MQKMAKEKHQSLTPATQWLKQHKVTFDEHSYEYEGQRYIRFRGKKLKVIKTYPISTEELELTCTERIEK